MEIQGGLGQWWRRGPRTATSEALFRAALHPLARAGAVAVLGSREGESCRDLLARVRRAGGSANVVLPGDDGLTVLWIERVDGPLVPGEDVQAVAHQTSVGMVASFLIACPGGATLVMVDPGQDPEDDRPHYRCWARRI